MLVRGMLVRVSVENGVRHLLNHSIFDISRFKHVGTGQEMWP